MTVEEIIEEIRGHRDIIDNLTEQYFSKVPPCANMGCAFWRDGENPKESCDISMFVTECKNYIQKKKPE